MVKVLKKLRSDHFEAASHITRNGSHIKDADLAKLLNDLNENANILSLTSAAGGGGAATEDDNVVAGLLATDTVLSVSQKTPGANDLPLLGFADQKDGSMDFLYSADPGAGAVVTLLVLRATK